MHGMSATLVLILVMVFFFATIFSMGIILLLTYLKVVRIKRPTDYFTWGIVGGILITFIYVTLLCNRSEHGGTFRVWRFELKNPEHETLNPKLIPAPVCFQILS